MGDHRRRTCPPVFAFRGAERVGVGGPSGGWRQGGRVCCGRHGRDFVFSRPRPWQVCVPSPTIFSNVARILVSTYGDAPSALGARFTAMVMAYLSPSVIAYVRLGAVQSKLFARESRLLPAPAVDRASYVNCLI